MKKSLLVAVLAVSLGSLGCAGTLGGGFNLPGVGVKVSAAKQDDGSHDVDAKLNVQPVALVCGLLNKVKKFSFCSAYVTE